MVSTKLTFTKNNQIKIYGLHTTTKQIKLPVIKINQDELEYVETFSFGVNLDTNISWKPHLSKVSNKIVRIIGIENKLKFIPPQNIHSKKLFDHAT